jgi:hypothetical protein
LTSNATYLNIVVALHHGKLVEIQPLRQLGDNVRRLLVVPDIAELLAGKSGQNFPHYLADAVIGRYVTGYLVTVSLKGNPTPKPDLERLEDLDEVWALCFRKPAPGWRILGRFAQRDVFIGFRAYDRHALGRKSNYTEKAQEIPNAWSDLLGPTPILHAETVGAYLSGVYRDVDQET